MHSPLGDGDEGKPMTHRSRRWELYLVAVVVVATSGCGGRQSRTGGSESTTTTPAVNSTTSTPAVHSTGISRTEAPLVEPLAPASVSASMEGGRVRISWAATGEDVAFYLCFRKTAGGGAWEPVGRVPAAVGAQTAYACTDDANRHGLSYVYGVQAVNVYGTHSKTTVSGQVTG
jgi:hypothetical protein